MNTQSPPKITIGQIEKQLRLRLSGYPPAAWGRKQTDDWDRQTRFIYHISDWAELAEKIAPLDKPLADYAVHRWFNFWSAQAVERMFCRLPGVQANLDPYDRLVDFSIRGITFDHKTSVFPKRYGHPPKFAWQNRADLIGWLYRNQSRQQRYHTANRLFIILNDRGGQHWKLRADLRGLYRAIHNYVTNFEPTKLVRIKLDGTTALSDIIWLVR